MSSTPADRGRIWKIDRSGTLDFAALWKILEDAITRECYMYIVFKAYILQLLEFALLRCRTKARKGPKRENMKYGNMTNSF